MVTGIVGGLLTAAITEAVRHGTDRATDLAWDSVAGAAVERYSRSPQIRYAPRRIDLDVAPLTEVAQQRISDLKVDPRWQIANDVIRRTGRPGLNPGARQHLLREASLKYNEIRRMERPGSVPQVHSALMYVFLTSLLGETAESLLAMQESLAAQFGGYGASFTSVDSSGPRLRRYDATRSSLKITMNWRPPLVSPSLLGVDFNSRNFIQNPS